MGGKQRGGVHLIGGVEDELWDEWCHPAKLDDPTAMVAMIDTRSEAIATTMTTHLLIRAVNHIRTADPALIRAI
ncbi:hypothetical protein OCAE111667_26880 [Occultella aeris]|uniref:Uncharacterized protein n=1 Tax=Occultella aeris TaxID=2761496 RepID=A0A7M4DHU2_9MICO|nr:hypothetical protein [Occultella aeris]VZO36487.1 hypothetical protein HALOF300_01693 [Occultella aeris]